MFLLRVLLLPVVAAMTAVCLLLSFLTHLAGVALGILSTIFIVLGVWVARTSELREAALAWALAFAASPYGLPLLAGWIVDRATDANLALKEFVFG